MTSYNIVWIDCEMTGLHPYLPPSDLKEGEEFLPDRILEVACIVTDADLNALNDGVEYIVKTDKDVLDKMNEWCIKQHGKVQHLFNLTGLTDSCLSSPHSMTDVDSLISTYILKHFPPGSGPALLAGSSVHADRAFIDKDLPQTASLLHYRILDVSSIKELARRWYPNVRGPRKEDSSHRALSDIKDSIAELRHYRKMLFKEPKDVV